MENKIIENVFLYKVDLFDTLTEQLSTRYILAYNFEDVSQLLNEMCSGNDLWISKLEEKGLIDYATGKVLPAFKGIL